MQFATNDYCMETSVALSSSVTSLPRIVSEDKSSNMPVRAQRRIGSQVPSANKFHTQKSSIQGNSSPSNDAQQYLSSRLNGTVKNTKNQPILSPISKNGADKTVSTVKINKALKKSTQSSSVLKNKKHSESQNEKNSKLPKLKKEVSIKETNMDDARSAVGSNSDSGSVENVFRNKLR